MASNSKSAREWFRVTRNEAESIDIDIYEDIGEHQNWWEDEKSGIGAKAFLDTLRAAKGKAVNLHINSGGGSVNDAYAMMTALRAHDGKVTAYVDGLAASAASFLLAAADEVVVSSVAWVMIHNATLSAWGCNAADLLDLAAYLTKIDEQIAGIYAKRSGTKGVSDFLEAMGETTWFTADEAVEWGLADRVEEAVAVAACITEDAATLNSAPPDALVGLRSSGAPSESVPGHPLNGIIESLRVTSDAIETITAENDEPGEQEPPAARERVVAINHRLFKARGRNENSEERKKNA